MLSSLGSSQPLGSGEGNAVERPGPGCQSAQEDSSYKVPASKLGVGWNPASKVVSGAGFQLTWLPSLKGW